MTHHKCNVHLGVVDYACTLEEVQQHFQSRGTDVLEKKVLQLQTEKNYWLQKEAALEDKIKHFESDVESVSYKEGTLKEKIKHLDNDRESLDLKKFCVITG
ncbi:hypothetical protein MKW98_024757 [Papaver atlanticum]|uniref:Uncharacterized protein n=1 Tax=Papaver atlanticum TaxID=357466 RepID=A0AAD4T471_9MAGN|nr:hypothetical protein MKW98_024757 [Papaver atlanticum]